MPESSPDRPGPNTAVTAFFLILGLLLVIGLYWLFRPAPAPETAPVEAEEPAAAATEPAAPDPTFIEIRGGHRVTGPAVIHATQGETIRLRLLSDRDTELHLHGYDLLVPLEAGVPAEAAFEARLSGRFEFEQHGASGAHHAVCVIEVQPR